MKRIFAASAFALFCFVSTALLVSTKPLAAEPADFGPGTTIGRVQGLPELPPELRNIYRQFRREALYFAAYAVHIEKGEGFSIQNFHDAASARAAALKGCEVLAQADGCVIYAVAMPASLPVDQASATGLSERAAKDFNTAYQTQLKPGTYAAFAISGASHHGYGFAYETAADAKDTAIAYCQVGVAQDMAELGPEARKYARARGWQTCKIVNVTFTPAD